MNATNPRTDQTASDATNSHTPWVCVACCGYVVGTKGHMWRFVAVCGMWANFRNGLEGGALFCEQ